MGNRAMGDLLKEGSPEQIAMQIAIRESRGEYFSEPSKADPELEKLLAAMIAADIVYVVAEPTNGAESTWFIRTPATGDIGEGVIVAGEARLAFQRHRDLTVEQGKLVWSGTTKEQGIRS